MEDLLRSLYWQLVVWVVTSMTAITRKTFMLARPAVSLSQLPPSPYQQPVKKKAAYSWLSQDQHSTNTTYSNTLIPQFMFYYFTTVENSLDETERK